MKYAFFGTPEFAAIILERLIGAGLPPAALICNPDRPVGRKKIITPPPAKQSILDQQEDIREQIEIFQPEKVSEIEEQLKAGNYDLFVVAAYGLIIPKRILDIPRLGTIGIHPSLLPHFRGATPIQSALLSNEKETGVSLFMVDEKVDHGSILSEEVLESYELTSLTYPALHDALARLGAEMLIKTLPNIERAIKEAKPQDESKATFTSKFKTEDGFVDEKNLEEALSGTNSEQAVIIDKKIRALGMEPGVYTIRNKERTKLLEAEVHQGKLILKRIQVAGKTPRTF
ncbi:MAG: methionyl-tRNA formyltransferase [Candidatus Paceibacterota bacterium]|jgi:methionyl-tRNA formyltransferase